eukprot:SAG22_NODE_13530_length_403_cov_1.023026_1_plen_73_part_10
MHQGLIPTRAEVLAEIKLAIQAPNPFAVANATSCGAGAAATNATAPGVAFGRASGSLPAGGCRWLHGNLLSNA